MRVKGGQIAAGESNIACCCRSTKRDGFGRIKRAAAGIGGAGR
jgi:hypothetical protein